MADELRDDMRTARRGSGLTFAVFARQAGYAESYLRNVENGTKPLTSDVAKAYDRVLATGGEFSIAVDGPSRQKAPWNRQETFTILVDMATGGGVDRRSFVTTTGAALTSLVGHWSSILTGQATPAALSDTPADAAPRLFGHIEERLEHLRHLDDEFDSGEMARMARNELALLTRLLKAGGLDETTENRAYSLAAEASRQVAWNLFDSKQHAAAERYYETALRASAEATDVLTGAYAMSFMAIQHYTAGDPNDAVKLLDNAEQTAGSRATPRMRAMLAARKARALSKTGDRRGCARALTAARDLLDLGPSEDDPDYLYWVTQGEIEMIAGSSALELNDPARAVRCFDAAVRADYPGDVQYPKSHAIYLARAAEAHLALHDLDAAVVQARHAGRCLGSVDSARSSSTLAGLRRQLSEHRGHPAVRAFLQEA
ncbi:putative transcriptional regulator [Catenulispora acidiphila DSM 44928]|uniref:Putative transcriptional regulator n=1 Tax=Catenulispora acidiphila (strain DSM 44928 / JCM 14897 / NBRC 102108 / NRRL B-24433 / ID139908) TaxID=479433 RepID=C7Q3F6_CATAD|nr:helix-turn-helix transcriptional regulator [Catenulispora acidiphila]ACU75721.1 putative transcriptional regulator [Catenulispora acidiphila DSM 44928]